MRVHTSDIRVRMSDINNMRVYTRYSNEWNIGTYEWDRGDIWILKCDIQMTYKYDKWHTNECEYIQMTYEWYMSDMRMAYDYITNDIRVHTIDTRVT